MFRGLQVLPPRKDENLPLAQLGLMNLGLIFAREAVTRYVYCVSSRGMPVREADMHCLR